MLLLLASGLEGRGGGCDEILIVVTIQKEVIQRYDLNGWLRESSSLPRCGAT